MLANNIWKITGELIEMTFAPYQSLRLSEGSWWSSNVISWVFIGIALVALFYWMNQMFGYKKNGKEDIA
jgi:hypothetical protein